MLLGDFMKLKELLEFGISELNSYHIKESTRKVKMVLSFLLNIPKSSLMIKENDGISIEVEASFKKAIHKLCKSIPIQYITNHQEFMKLDFYVDEHVLIPQPDTEILVEEVLKNCKPNMDVLDLCTGSGAIAIAISKYSGYLNISASDISNDALKIAKKNAFSILGDNHIQFIQSNLFENINRQYDMIVSNPPYIETELLSTLDKEVQWEPLLALDGGIDGLDFYRIIAREAKKHLKPEGFLYLEIGYHQKEGVTEILKQNEYKNINCVKDLSNNNRVIYCEVK